MLQRRSHKALIPISLTLTFALAAGCESYPWLGDPRAGRVASGGVFATGEPFTENLILARTFTEGASVTTVTFQAGDLTRTPLGIDFNNDGRVDPVVGYGQGRGGVVQILLSDASSGSGGFISLTLDGNVRWHDLADVAVGDLDGDGQLDIVAAAEDGIVYLHHPSRDPNSPEQSRTTFMRLWGSDEPELEYLEGSSTVLTNEEIQEILAQALPPTVNLDDYDITIMQGYTNVEIADFDNDLDNDVVGSRHLNITLTPKDNTNLLPIQIIAGELQLFINPGGGAATGENWILQTVGTHERYLAELDRDGAAGLLAHDMDGDGDLDLVSAAGDDINVHVAWFQNPQNECPDVSPPFDDDAWKHWRIGSVRDAFAIDVADLTGDGWPDVVATGGEQQQVVLFEHPGVSFCDRQTRSRYEYDWDTHAIVTFESYVPRDVKALDVDNDGVLELVVGGTAGAVRYFERGLSPRATWTGNVILNFEPPGTVGLLGYGDVDGDNDVDLVAVVDASDESGGRVVWIRNDTAVAGF